MSFKLASCAAKDLIQHRMYSINKHLAFLKIVILSFKTHDEGSEERIILRTMKPSGSCAAKDLIQSTLYLERVH